MKNMKFVKFRIHNYKSIEDSGDCYLSDGMTILAGKNESGKTSILEALEDCDERADIREAARPIEGQSEPYIDLFFELSEDEMNDIFRKVGLEMSANADTIIGIRKPFRDKSKLYKLIESGEFFSDETEVINWEDVIPKINDAIIDIDENVGIVELTNQTPESYMELLKNALAEQVIEIDGYEVTIPEENDVEAINNAITIIRTYMNSVPPSDSFLETFLGTRFPYFILFSSFEDSFPDSIQVSELKTNPWAKDLEEVSSFRINNISDSNHQKQRNHLQKVNAEFTDRFNEYWTQDAISLQVERNGDIVNFWITEGDVAYKPSQRSKGQQWYLSFYVKVLARSKEDVLNIILIDEPGLYLHARAQKDLLNALKQHSSEFPVIFSTHSPYLINEENLENIRLVEKHDRKTTIHGKVHSRANKETLTPILTAIGLGLNDSITNIDQKNNIVVEGPEDTFYLQAFRALLPKSIIFNANFIYGGGAGNMGIVGTILAGWGCDVFYLYDKDDGKKQGETCLKNTWAVFPEKIKEVMSVEKSTIADILSNADFKKYVLSNEKLTFKSKNSEYIKTNKKDKVLLARLFLQSVKSGNVILDSESNENIKSLFEKLIFDSSQ